MILFLDEDYRKLPKMIEDDKIFNEMFDDISMTLSMAHRVLDGREEKKGRWKYFILRGVNEKRLLNSTQFETDEIKWVIKSQENYYWLYRLFLEFCQEYRNRFEVESEYEQGIGHIVKQYPSNLNQREPLKFPYDIEFYELAYQSMAEEIK